MKKAKLINAGILFIAAVTLGLLYELEISVTDAYRGYLPNIFTIQNLALSAPMVIGVAITMPASMRRPSDFFLLFYAVIVLLSCSLFGQVTGVLDGIGWIMLYSILLVPVVFVVLIRRVSLPVRFVGIFDKNVIYYSLVIILTLAVVVGAATNTGSGFDWDSMYARRFAGRDSIGSRNITAYLLSMTMNGIGPFLAFAGVLRKRPLLTICGLAFSVFSFWLLGLKAPFVMCLVFMMLGYYLRAGRLTRFPTLVGSLVALVGVVALGELVLFGHSLLAAFIVRRAFVVQGALQTYFFDLIQNSFMNSLYEGLFGVDSSSYGPITFLVGAEYLGNAATNANTNAFLFALSSGGVVSFFLASIFVGTFFAFIDSYYYATKRADVFFVGAIYGLLLTEQAYTTALVSSGVGAVLAAILLMRRDAFRKEIVRSRRPALRHNPRASN